MGRIRLYNSFYERFSMSSSFSKHIPLYFAFVLFLLSACNRDKDEPFIPPAACIHPMIVGEFSEITHKSTSEKDAAYAAALTNVWAQCEQKKDQEKTILYIRFLVKRPQSGIENNIFIPYFVALVDKNDSLIGKSSYIATASFAKNQKRSVPVEKVEFSFPLPKGTSIEDFTFLVGLQLDEAQLEKNIRKREKINPSSSRKKVKTAPLK